MFIELSVVLVIIGGTADITIHQVGNDGRLRELHKATGGSWGGTKVDEAFISILDDILGDDVVDKFIKDHTSDYMYMRREFEVKKRKVGQKMGPHMYIKYPLNLKLTYETMTQNDFTTCIKQSPYGDQISAVSDKLKISSDIMTGLFSDVLTHLEDHIRDILSKPCAKQTKTFLLVGGFSESPIIYETIKQKFPHIKVIVPDESGLTVLKGAVIFGHQPKAIGARVAKYTVGMAVSKPFIKGQHPVSKRKDSSNGAICVDVFHKYVEIGDSVEVDDEHAIPFTAARGSSTNRIRIYKSTERDPMFVTDDGCSLLGEIIMTSGEVDLNNSQIIDVSMTFGGTELNVEARRRGQSSEDSVYKAKFDLLQN